VLHFDHTRAVEPLERSADWQPGEVEETFPSGIRSASGVAIRRANDGESFANGGKRKPRSRGLLFSSERNDSNPTNPMPYYEFICRKCHKKFGEVLTIKEHDSKKVHCPKCQSTSLEKVIEPFFAKTASKTHGS
jgi:putative FmdB family regulatory protein